MNMSSEFDKKKAFPNVSIRNMTMIDYRQDHHLEHDIHAKDRKPESDNESLDNSLSGISEEVSSVHTSDLSSFDDDISSISSPSLSSSCSDITESNVAKVTEAESEIQM